MVLLTFPHYRQLMMADSRVGATSSRSEALGCFVLCYNSHLAPALAFWELERIVLSLLASAAVPDRQQGEYLVSSFIPEFLLCSLDFSCCFYFSV